ncbi:MAG: AarF/ABC1/UbiB kinase family protein [Pseudomonadota bacterium]
MADSDQKQKAVPTSRLSRFGRMARLTAGVATGVLAEGARQLSQGNAPKMSDMLLTPANARRVAKQLSTMRGAAMKVGQLLSMESNELLPKELATILAQLRDSAVSMPRQQLETVLIENLGEDWLALFTNFDFTPLAAASIGQVHRATTLEGDDIVLKIQYPGISKSIDSDVDNIASLLKITNLIPEHMDISDLLADAKRQLHDEANYFTELDYLSRFSEVFAQWDQVLVPTPYEELTTQHILAMSYQDGVPIEEAGEYAGVSADEIMTDLFRVYAAELFELRLMQTDGNFANFRYDLDSNSLVLLDFGAAREFSSDFVKKYAGLMRAAMDQDQDALIQAADALGYEASKADTAYQELLINVFTIALEPFATSGVYDFSEGAITERLAELTNLAYDFKKYWQTPPTDILYLHRKLGGLYLLANRLGAKVDCSAIIRKYI